MNKNQQKYGRIGILMGGPSSERAISLKSGEAIYHSLKNQGFEVVPIDLISCQEKELRAKLEMEGCQLVFIALHGEYGEDGKVQRILSDMGIPFTGSDEESSRRAFHKPTTQNILKKAGVRIPRYVSVSKGTAVIFSNLIQELGSNKCVLKPVAEGSSIGVHIVEDQASLDRGLADAFSYGESVMIENFIEGREMTVGILDGNVLPVIEIVPRFKFFDYKAKYEKGMTSYHVPAVIDNAICDHLQAQALKVYRLLGCRHLARVDFILKDQSSYCLEINTIPGFTQTSLLPKAAEHVGISFHQLTSKLVDCAYGTKEKSKSKSIV